MNNNELERCQQQIIRKQRLELIVKNMLIERESLEIKIDGIRQYLLEQNEELDKTKDISLAYMYYEMFREKHEKVDRSIRKKYIFAAMYSLLYKEIEELDKDIASCKKELSCLNGCKKRYLNSYITTVNQLKNKGDSKSFEIMELDNKIRYLTSQKREMKCAIEAGNV
ncbi:MAG: hypothetical protein IJ272_01285, partial [Clostridia bacterium]|nr:hypothetical protein [Clostridia bacterium]